MEAHVIFLIDFSEDHHEKFVEQRKVNIDDHGSDNILTGDREPLLVKISLLPIEDLLCPNGALTLEISIYQEQEKPSVKQVA